MATSTTYEPIMVALLAFLKENIPANIFLTFQRGIYQWEQLAQQQGGQPVLRQPALFLYDGIGFGGGKTKYEQKGRATPAIRTIDRTIVIYAQENVAGGYPGGQVGGTVNLTETGGGALFHPLIEAVENALALSDADGALTLGRLVSHCWLEGDAHILSPDTDPNGQGMATLPVRIMIP